MNIGSYFCDDCGKLTHLKPLSGQAVCANCLGDNFRFVSSAKVNLNGQPEFQFYEKEGPPQTTAETISKAFSRLKASFR